MTSRPRVGRRPNKSKTWPQKNRPVTADVDINESASRPVPAEYQVLTRFLKDALQCHASGENLPMNDERNGGRIRVAFRASVRKSLETSGN